MVSANSLNGLKSQVFIQKNENNIDSFELNLSNDYLRDNYITYNITLINDYCAFIPINSVKIRVGPNCDDLNLFLEDEVKRIDNLKPDSSTSIIFKLSILHEKFTKNQEFSQWLSNESDQGTWSKAWWEVIIEDGLGNKITQKSNKIVGEPILEKLISMPENNTLEVRSVSIEPDKGALQDKYRYIVRINGLNKRDCNLLKLVLTDELDETWLEPITPEFCYEGGCEFQVNGLSSIGDYLGNLKYRILFNNILLKEGIGPNIYMTMSAPLGRQTPRGFSYNVSLRSIECPTNFTLCYKDGERYIADTTYTYDSCPEWTPFVWSDRPRYQAFKVVNGCDCN